jgi:hypothetical protein
MQEYVIYTPPELRESLKETLHSFKIDNILGVRLKNIFVKGNVQLYYRYNVELADDELSILKLRYSDDITICKLENVIKFHPL